MATLLEAIQLQNEIERKNPSPKSWIYNPKTDELVTGEDHQQQEQGQIINKLQEDSIFYTEIGFAFIGSILLILFLKCLVTGEKFLKETIKIFWILIFFLATLIVCIFYVPFETKKVNGTVNYVGHSIVSEIPKKYKNIPTQIYYEEMIFREIIILASCGAGYAASVLMFKKD